MIPSGSIQKSSASADPLKPFDFSATFNATLADVPLQPGWNHVRLRSVNPDGFVGYADASVEVLAEPIVDVRLELEDYDLYQNSLAGVWAQFRRGDGVWSGPELLNWQNAGGSFADHIYVSADGGTVVEFTGTPILDPLSPDTFTAIISKGSVGVETQVIVFTEDGNDPPHAQGTGVFDDFDLTDYSQHTLLIGDQVIADFSTGGSMEAYLLELVMPAELKDEILKVEAFGIGNEWDLIEYGGGLYLADFATNTLAPTAFYLPLTPAELYPQTVAPPDRTGTFAEGFAAGLKKPFIELKDAGKKAVEWAIEESFDRVSLGTKIGIWLGVHGPTVVDTTSRIVNDLMALGPAMILQDFASNPGLTLAQLLTNSHPQQHTLQPEVNAVFEVGAELLHAVSEEVQNLQGDPYKQGWYLGYATTTIAIEVLGTVATAGVGKLATLAWIAPKFYAAGGRFALAMDRIGLDANGNVIDDAAKLAKDLQTTAMCFVAGTLIHTIDGLVPIEQVAPGTLVWSRDEHTGQWGYRPVTETFVTRPDALYHVSYDPDGTGPLPEETLSTTAPHPFWVADVGGFLAASELEVGHELVLADGSAAWVTGVRPEHAPPDERFTTYNFAVTDFATYFAGESGVWVHNTGNALCEKAFSIWERRFTHMGESPATAFNVVETVLTKYMTQEAFTNRERLTHLGDVLDEVISKTRIPAPTHPLWSSKKGLSGPGNMYGHWIDHQQDFPNLSSAVEYVNRAMDFVGNPTPTMKIGLRPNRMGQVDAHGNPIMEKVFLEMSTGEFAVQIMSGPESSALRTYFPKRGGPADWLAYWNDQGITQVIQ